jgi:hypothetical protein
LRLERSVTLRLRPVEAALQWRSSRPPEREGPKEIAAINIGMEWFAHDRLHQSRVQQGPRLLITLSTTDQHLCACHTPGLAHYKWQVLYALVDKARKVGGIDEEVSPLLIESGCRFRGYRLADRPALLLEFRHIVANSDEHVAEFLKLGAVADRTAVARNDDRSRRGGGQIGLGRCNHSVDAAAGGIVDKRVDPVPIRIPRMEDIRIGKRNRYVTVGMRAAVVLEGDLRAIEPSRC